MNKPKILMSNREKTVGLVEVDEKDLYDVGIFSVDLVYAGIEAVDAFKAFREDAGETTAIRVGCTKDGQGRVALLFKPDGAEGTAWVAVCNRTEAP